MNTETDKSKMLTGSVSLLNQKLHFKGEVTGNEPVSIDYTPPLGDNLGYTSLELFLLSLSSCVGSAILVILRKMNKHIGNFDIRSTGYRRDVHPTGFKSVSLEVVIESDNAGPEDLQKVNSLIKGICPVASMISNEVEVNIGYRLNGILLNL
jgi:putative redox protein